jgi:ABC-type lipoprotein export system ATPase subunit
VPRDQQQADQPHAAVEVDQLCFGYGGDSVVSMESFRLDRSHSCALIGPSGCGKSTFVHLLAGLLTADTGAIRILGQDLAELTEAERDRFRGRHIGFVFQRFHLIPSLTVRENLQLAQRLSRRRPPPGHIDEILERLGLAGLGRRRPAALSHGQAQRVAIARALVHTPELVIADEPTSALDDGHAQDALALITDITSASGAALLVVTHDQRVRGRLDRDFEMGHSA